MELELQSLTTKWYAIQDAEKRCQGNLEFHVPQSGLNVTLLKIQEARFLNLKSLNKCNFGRFWERGCSIYRTPDTQVFLHEMPHKLFR